LTEKQYRNPAPTVDMIIRLADGGIVLVERKNPPFGLALPGGFVDYGESLESAAIREAKEETELDIVLAGQFHTYSDPSRDPRSHTISTVFLADATGTPVAGDDAAAVCVVTEDSLPEKMAFDHREILQDYFEGKY